MQHCEVKPIMQYYACFIIGIVTTNIAVKFQVEIIISLPLFSPSVLEMPVWRVCIKKHFNCFIDYMALYYGAP